jgi:hypothetical protein
MNIGKDKIKHFAGNVAMVTVTGMVLHMLFVSRGYALLFGVSVALSVSIWKEFVDPKFDWQDILADVLGILAGALILGMMT